MSVDHFADAEPVGAKRRAGASRRPIMIHRLPLAARSRFGLFCGGKHMRARWVKALKNESKGLVVDVGAYDGSEAVSFAEAGHDVLSFEPTPSKRATIERAIARSRAASRISFQTTALSNASGTMAFWVTSSRKGGAQQDSLNKPAWPATRIDVPVTMLDQAVGNRTVIFAKIDTQGNDGRVILGARRLLRHGRLPVLLFEVSPRLGGPSSLQWYTQAVALLERHGHRCFDCMPHGWPGWPNNAPMLIPLAQLLAERQNSTYRFRGFNHGGWTELVCTSQPHRLGLAAWD